MDRPQRLTASRSRPQLLRPERDRWDDRQREGTVAFAPEVRPEDPSEALAEGFFARPAGVVEEAPARALSAIVSTTEEIHALSEREIEAETIAHYAATIAMLARHRRERPVRELGSNERQLLANIDAIAAMGGGCIRALVEWWRADNAEDPWKTWAAAFALASFDGTDPLEAIAHVLEELPEDAGAHAATAAEALLVAPNLHVGDLARELARSPNAVARAVGIETLGRKGALSPDPSVASLAARKLARWDRPEPYFAIRNGRLRALGAAALEVLVLFGDANDVDCFDELLSEIAPTPRVLSAVARFGHPSARAYLVHHLANPELADAAAGALTTLFGACVDPRNARSAAAWRGVLERVRFDEGVRLRGGEPWRLRAVAADCLRGDIARAELEAQLDELAVRTGLSVDVDLTLWSTDTRPLLEQTMKTVERADAGFKPGSWDCKVADARGGAGAPAASAVDGTPHRLEDTSAPPPQSFSPFDRPSQTQGMEVSSFPLEQRAPAPRPAAGVPAQGPPAPIPELTLEEYATLTAELLAHGARRVYPKYGLEDPSVREVVLDGWAKRLTANAEMRAQWDTLYMAAVKRLGIG